MQTSRIDQKVPKRHVSDSAVERFGRYFLRLAPSGGALDKDAANGRFAGLFPRGGPDVFFSALFINPRDDLGSGGKHVAFSSRFHLEIDALEGGFSYMRRSSLFAVGGSSSLNAILGPKSGGGAGFTFTCELFELY